FRGERLTALCRNEASDGSTLPRLLRPRRAQGERHRVSPLAGRRAATPPGGADVRHQHARAAAAGGVADRPPLPAPRHGVARGLLAAGLQTPPGPPRAPPLPS